MNEAERRVPGERLAERMQRRTHRRPRLGMSPTFYARLGLDDPWAVEGVDAAPAAGNDEMVFLSAAPYYAMMRKLAASRKRRERRLQRFLERRAGVTLRAGSSALPSLGVPSLGSAASGGSFAARRVATLSASDMSLPAAAPAPSAAAPLAATEGRTLGGEVERKSSWRPATKVANPWFDTPYVAARVGNAAAAGTSASAATSSVASGGAATRPAERVVARLTSAQQAVDAERVVGGLTPSAMRRVARAKQRIEVEEAAPVQLSQAEVVRVVRRAQVARPMVRIVEEEIAPPAAARPVQTATTRMVDGASRGLRPLALRSPAMAVAMADLAHAADVDRAAAQALAAPARGESMRPAAARRVPPTQRALGRAGQARSSGGTEASLSASPVSSSRTASTRPVAASPVARQSARDGGAGGQRQTTLSSTTSPRVPASAAAAARLPAAAAFLSSGAAASASALTTLAVDARGAVVRVAAPDGTAGAVRLAATGALSRLPSTGAWSALGRAALGEAGPGEVSRLQAGDARDPRSVVPRPVAHARGFAPTGSAGGLDSGVVSLHAAAPVAMPTAGGGRRFVSARLARASRLASSVPTAVMPRAPTVESAAGADLDLGFGASAPGSRVGSARLPGQGESGKVIRGAFVEPVPSSAKVASRPEPAASASALAAVEERALLEGRNPARAARRSRLESSGAPVMGAAAWALSRLEPSGDATASRSSSLVPRPVAPALVSPALVPPRTSSSAPVAAATVAGASAEARASSGVRGAESAGRRASSQTGSASDGGAVPSRSASPSRLAAPETVLPTRPPVAAQGAGRAAPDADQRSAVGEPESRQSRVATTPAASRPRRPLAVAAAERAERVEGRPSARAVQADEAVVSTPARRDATRRSGPLSWAYSPVAEASLVASAAALASRGGPASSSSGVASRSSRPAPDAVVARRDTGAGSGVGAVLPVAAPSTRAIVEELSARGLLSHRYSATTPVRTPDGRYVAARVAEALPGLAVLPALAGPIAVATEPARRAPGFRTPEVRFVGAPVAATGEGAYTAARTSRTRPTDWVAARTGVTEATAYRGAIGVGTPEATFRSARVGTTPVTESVGASSSVGAAPSPGVRRNRNVAPAATTVAPAAVSPVPSETQAASATPRRTRPAMESTLIDMASDAQPAAASPNWAQRAEGRPLVRSAQGLFDSLARATTAEQVVAVIAQRAGGFAGSVPLTEPMREVVAQIRQEISAPSEVAEPVVLATRAPEVEAPRATVLRGSRVDPVRGSARTSRGAVRPVRSTAVVRGPGGGDDRISKLVKRLTDLIHLAEDQRRLSEAQSQVRMAEDTAAARAEGSAPMGQSAAGGVKLDIETFTREVLEVVNRELELRRERRMEDSDESGWW